jgi:hypothetical protein
MEGRTAGQRRYERCHGLVYGAVPQAVPERPEEGDTGRPNAAEAPAEAGTRTGAADVAGLGDPS